MPTKKLLYGSLLISSLILTFSCKKGEITYDFQGHVIESAGNTPLSGVDVTVTQVLFSSSVANFNYQFAGSAVTDANGDWAVSFKRGKVTDFRIQLKKDGYFTEVLDFTSADVSVEDPNTYDMPMDAEAWVKFDLENIAPQSGDQLTMVLLNFREGCGDCGVNTFYYFYDDLDTTLTYKTTAGVYHRFQLNDVGSASLIDDSVLTVPFDTVSYSFSY